MFLRVFLSGWPRKNRLQGDKLVVIDTSSTRAEAGKPATEPIILHRVPEWLSDKVAPKNSLFLRIFKTTKETIRKGDWRKIGDQPMKK